MKRRTFLLSALGVGGALIVGWGVLPPRSRLGEPADFPARDGEVALNGWVKLARDGSAVVAMPRSEMGQGVHTALLMLVAEELDLPLARMRLEQAPVERLYGNLLTVAQSLPIHPRDLDGPDRPVLVRTAQWTVAKFARELGLNVTGGSTSVADAWEAMRTAGAAARASLVAEAARRWGVAAETCTTQDGAVVHPAGRRVGYAELAAGAALSPADAFTLKPPSQWKLIGQAAPRREAADKATGTAAFGMDARLAGTCYAAVRMCPVLGGQVASLDDAPARARPGVLAVVQVPPLAGATGGYAVIAEHYWQAKQALDAVRVSWDEARGGSLDDRAVMERLRQAVETGEGFTFHRRGDVDAAFSGAARTVEARFEAPHLAHETMEPMNATARWQDGRLEVWAPTQVPGLARAAAAKAAGVGADRVILHVPFLGGGFGRRLDVDFVAQAAHLARALPGRPVQMIWSREEDIRHDFYRPAQVAKLAAAFDARQRLIGLRIRSAGDAVKPHWLRRAFPLLPHPLPDKTASEGLFDQPYDIASQRIAHVAVDTGVPVGFWRSVGHSHNAFFAECFMDELAAAAGQDPVAFRRAHLGTAPRHRAVLDLAAEKAGWGTPLPAGRARGVALCESFGTVVAEVAEVSLEDGRPRVHRVVCAIDCGVAVNPQGVAQQMEGGVVFGLSAALDGRLAIREGRVRQSNFHDLPVLRMAEAPVVQTWIVPSARPPSGVGETAVPPIAPAVANALYVITGRRARSLPLVEG